jgi:hypothetical protein
MSGSDSTASASANQARGQWQRRIAGISRWLHVYLSMLSFGILFFFAATGLTLNHPDWFSVDHEMTTRTHGAVAVAWVAGDDASVAKLELVEHLRRQERAKGAVAEFRLESAECTVVFKGPGYASEARIDRKTGRYEFNETRFGFVALINDLHKARDTGLGWSRVVDLSAGLMIAVSVTGMALICFLKRKFVPGALTAVAGGALALGAYFWLVP